MVTLKLRLAWRQEARVLGTEAPPPFGLRLHCGNKQLAEKAFVFGHGAEKPRSGGAQQGVPGREIPYVIQAAANRLGRISGNRLVLLGDSLAGNVVSRESARKIPYAEQLESLTA